jgi:S1-C subfamily serine protease
MIRPFRLGTISALAALLLAVSTPGQTGKGSDTDSGEKIYQRTLRSTVWVLVPVEARRARMGTGSLIDAHRQLILTNYHVVGDKDQVLVYFPMFQKGKLVAERKAYIPGSKPIHGKVVVKDSRRDLALIRLEALPPDAKPLKLAKDSPRPAQTVHSIGNPGASGALWVYTVGSVRQIYHQKFRTSGRDGEEGFEVDAEIVETQSPVNQGDSGGPVVNDRGELVAVVQGHLEESKARAYSIFIDVSEVRGLLASKRLAKIAPPPPEEKPTEVQSTSDKSKVKSEEDPAVQKERDAARKLKLAKAFIDDGKKDIARNRCKDIITQFPNTKAAKEAKELLEKLE